MTGLISRDVNINKIMLDAKCDCGHTAFDHDETGCLGLDNDCDCQNTQADILCGEINKKSGHVYSYDSGVQSTIFNKNSACILIVNSKGNILVVSRRGMFTNKAKSPVSAESWSLPDGFILPTDETLVNSVNRIFNENLANKSRFSSAAEIPLDKKIFFFAGESNNTGGGNHRATAKIFVHRHGAETFFISCGDSISGHEWIAPGEFINSKSVPSDPEINLVSSCERSNIYLENYFYREIVKKFYDIALSYKI